MRKMITLICPLICLDFVSISPKPFSVTFIKVSINKKAQIFFGSVDFILLGSFTWDFIILDQIKYDSYYMNDPILGSFHVWGCINDALLILSINLKSVAWKNESFLIKWKSLSPGRWFQPLNFQINYISAKSYSLYVNEPTMFDAIKLAAVVE